MLLRMSVNYASRLSDYDYKGKCGLPEVSVSVQDNTLGFGIFEMGAKNGCMFTPTMSCIDFLYIYTHIKYVHMSV